MSEEQDKQPERQRKGPPRGASAPAGGERKPEPRPPSPPPREPRSRGKRDAGWGDGIDHAFCEHVRHVIPPAFPVTAREGVAIVPPAVVARRETAVLLCDGLHAGPHCWPGEEPVSDEETLAASRQPSRRGGRTRAPEPREQRPRQ